MPFFARSRPADPDPGVVLRRARPADEVQIAPLARRAGEVVPHRPLAVAEREGRIVAVQSIPDGVLVSPHGEQPSRTLGALHRFADAARDGAERRSAFRVLHGPGSGPRPTG